MVLKWNLSTPPTPLILPVATFRLLFFGLIRCTLCPTLKVTCTPSTKHSSGNQNITTTLLHSGWETNECLMNDWVPTEWLLQASWMTTGCVRRQFSGRNLTENKKWLMHDWRMTEMLKEWHLNAWCKTNEWLELPNDWLMDNYQCLVND